MQLIRHRQFRKQYAKLSKSQQELVNDAIIRFVKDPLDPALRNHKLKGRYSSLRSIDAAFDLRILFLEQDDYVLVTFLQVGSHNQLY